MKSKNKVAVMFWILCCVYLLCNFAVPYLKQWWRVYKQDIEPLVKEHLGDDDAHSSLSVLSLPSVVGAAPGNYSARAASAGSGPADSSDPSPPDAWDHGRVDYTGRDRLVLFYSVIKCHQVV